MRTERDEIGRKAMANRTRQEPAPSVALGAKRKRSLEDTIATARAACFSSRVPKATHHIEPDAEDERRDRVIRKHRIDAADAIGRITGPMLEAITTRVGLLDTPPLRRVKDWLASEGQPPVLGLMGTVGRGKSVAAAYAISERGGLWVTADWVLRAFLGIYSDSMREQSRMRAAELLVVDEVGGETDGKAMAAAEVAKTRGQMGTALLRLLDDRQNRTRITIIASNLSERSFKATYPGIPLQSRLSEIAALHEFTGEDMRRGKSNAE